MAANVNKDLSKPLKKRTLERPLDLAPAPVSSATTNKSSLDLNDWLGTSVLARYGSGNTIYRPGRIHSIQSTGTVQVLLDKDTKPITYTNVFESLDILGNHPPSAALLIEGQMVCVKEKSDDNLFVVARIKSIDHGPPVKCLVESDNFTNTVWIPRVNMRLVQPPWHDDLSQHAFSHPVSSLSLHYSN